MRYGLAHGLAASLIVLFVVGCAPKTPPPPPPVEVVEEVQQAPPPPPEPPAPPMEIRAKKEKRGKPYRVKGKTYYPLIKPDGYEERGIASWYGPSFDGLPTACGESFDMNGITAAHKLLPMHTMIEVTNLENGHKLVLPVKDRGPFVPGRVLDLSYGAAQKLGVVERGLARVSLRAVGGVAGAKKSDLTGNFFVHIGAFKLESDAKQLQEDMRREGHRNTTIVRSVRKDESLWRVEVGPYKSLRTAEKARDKIDEVYPSAFVVSNDSATTSASGQDKQPSM